MTADFSPKYKFTVAKIVAVCYNSDMDYAQKHKILTVRGTDMQNKYPFFVRESETTVAELGSRFIQNYLSSGRQSTGFVVISQRRAYFNGVSYYKNGSRWDTQIQERVVDLKEITGSGYIVKRHTGLLVTAILLAAVGAFTMFADVADRMIFSMVMPVFFFPAILFLLFYLSTGLSLYTIDFAGTSIGFNTKWFGKRAINAFRKELSIAIEEVPEEEPVEMLTVQTAHSAEELPAQRASVDAREKADALREYAKLKDEGLISEEEFLKMKAELIAGKTE